MSSKIFEKLKAYKCYSNDCVFFKYIFDESDIQNLNDQKQDENDTNLFRPEYTHQIFGDEETIFGYKNLRINYYLTPGLLDAYIGLTYKDKITSQRFDGIEADDVYGAFQEFGCSPGFTRNLDVFCTEFLKQDRQFKPFGTKISEYTKESVNYSIKRQGTNGNIDKPANEDRSLGTYEIYRVDASMSEFESQKFIDYLVRVQTMLVYYIETSNFIDHEDPQWTHYFLYEKRKQGNSEFRYITIGYLSVYNYYAYPDKTRTRVSQILILPTYQNMGHGGELVEAVYKDACQNPRVIDVTAESPSIEFIKLRDYVTTKMCTSLSMFKDRSIIKKGFTSELAKEALSKFKLPKSQTRRCYEVIRLAYTNQNNTDEWKDYRLDLKKRFYLPFIKRSKCARNAGAITNGPSTSGEENSKQPDVSGVNQKKSLESRFGASSSSSGFSGNSESTTTIGFGNLNTRGAVSARPNGTKTVSFASTKNTSLNTSNSTTDNSHNSSDMEENSNDSPYDNDTDQNDRGEKQLTQENLFVNEQERKNYLEQQFQESVNDYRKILKRLEDNCVSLA